MSFSLNLKPLPRFMMRWCLESLITSKKQDSEPPRWAFQEELIQRSRWRLLKKRSEPKIFMYC